MRLLILVPLFTLFFFATSFAQAPQMINYQGVARDLSGNPLPNQNISLRMSVLSGSPAGTNEYSETHSVTTNNLGLFTIQIGNGIVQSGNFTTIDWGGTSHYLQIEMNENGGTSYTLIGTTQMVSVPYALYAENGSKWKEDGFGLHYELGNIGIGNISDSLHSLSLIRDIPSGAGRYLLSINNTSTSNGSNASMKLKAGNGTGITQLTHWSPTYTAISGLANYSGLVGTGNGIALISNGITKIMNGSSNPVELMRIDNNGNVGIGTSTPVSKLEIVGDNNTLVQFTEHASSHPRINLTNSAASVNSSIYSVDFINSEPTLNFGFPQGEGSGRHFNFRSNGSNHLTISGIGNIGISTGNSLPTSKLQVKGGDIHVDNIGSGIILTSPNGNCWRVTIDNSGNLIKTAITCP